MYIRSAKIVQSLSSKVAINKAKAVELCADMIYAGKQRKDIMQEFARAYSLKERAIDNYIKYARVIVARRQEAADAIRAKIDAEQTEQIAVELGISRKRVIAEWCKIAFLDIRRLYTDGGSIKSFNELDDDTAGAIAGVEVFEEHASDGEHLGTNRKVKMNPKTTALIELGKILGYTPQPGLKIEAKDEQTGKSFKITLNLG